MKKKISLIFWILLVVVIIFGALFALNKCTSFKPLDKTINSIKKIFEEPKENIVSESYLQDVVNVSRLSTYKCTYNAVCTVKNDKDKVAYYVYYAGTIEMGLKSFEDVGFKVDKNNIIVSMPQIEITEKKVSLESLEYMFKDKSANDRDVSSEAYNACLKDLEDRVNNNPDMYDKAKENAENTIKGLIDPLVNNGKNKYKFKFKYEGDDINEEK